MTYTQLVYLHLATVLPAFAIGAFQLLRRKGTPSHKLLGKIYMVLMLATGLITLAMPAEVGPRFLGHFGFIHLFSFLTLYSVPSAYFAIRRGNIKLHRANMIGLYVGGILIAGSFAFAPGRMLHEWLFG
ncbi:MAG TPA: DUF2306 domain-containing protein [Anaerolineales bacterium]|nr:DUF2306 domain-containing protein [Anaerolineales bacterium]